MKKKGFTLIELLAVIVILGIIALIVGATIGGIIERTRKEAYKHAKECGQLSSTTNIAKSNDELFSEDLW